MSGHALPVVPEVGDEVAVTYKSRRSRDEDGYEHKTRSGTVERVAKGHGEDGVWNHLLVRETERKFLIATVAPDGEGYYAYSVSYDEDDVDRLQISEFYATDPGYESNPSSWTLSWANADKTRRVELGRVVEVALRSVGSD